MKFGFQLPTGMEGLIVPPDFIPPGDFISMAVTGEKLGYDSLWGNDHYAVQDYVRARFDTPPRFYDVLTVLAAVVAVTKHVELGTSILVLPMRDLVSVARQVSTLDQLSGGRLLLGVGIGAYKEEYAAVRPDLVGENRGTILEEALSLLNLLLSEGSVTFQGKYYHVESLELFPKPFRKPFPILIGGHQKLGIERAVKFGEGWIPGWRPFDELKEWIQLLYVKATEAGRDPRSLIIAPQFSCLVAHTMEEAVKQYENSGMVQHRKSLAYTGRDPGLAMENNLIGTPEVLLKKIEQLDSFGVNHLSALTFCVNSRSEFEEQIHYFAEEVMHPYRKKHTTNQPSCSPRIIPPG